jgi:hypothetical protein
MRHFGGGFEVSDWHENAVTTLLIVTIITLFMPLPAHAEQHHRLECPQEAPAEWALPKPAVLEQPAVLSQPVGEPIDDNAPPSLVPDQGYARGNVWHNVWATGDQPDWSHFVDCQY